MSKGFNTAHWIRVDIGLEMDEFRCSACKTRVMDTYAVCPCCNRQMSEVWIENGTKTNIDEVAGVVMTAS